MPCEPRTTWSNCYLWLLPPPRSGDPSMPSAAAPPPPATARQAAAPAQPRPPALETLNPWRPLSSSLDRWWLRAALVCTRATCWCWRLWTSLSCITGWMKSSCHATGQGAWCSLDVVCAMTGIMAANGYGEGCAWQDTSESKWLPAVSVKTACQIVLECHAACLCSRVEKHRNRHDGAFVISLPKLTQLSLHARKDVILIIVTQTTILVFTGHTPLRWLVATLMVTSTL